MSPQLTITQGPPNGAPGMPFDGNDKSRDIVSVQAAVNIPFGIYTELNGSGLLVPMQDATTGTSFSPEAVGVSFWGPLGVEQEYQTYTVPNVGTGSSAGGYLAGQSVPVMRRGRIWALTDAGGTAVRIGAINVHHSSTAAHAQGVFTFTAPQTTSGDEIDVAPSVTVWNPNLIGGTGGPTFTDPFGNTYSIIPLEVSL